MPTQKTIQIIQTRLLDWYHREQRDLPWRQSRDPYHILVSEIMLQQTQVKTVVPYYRRWLKSFPTLQSLARAPEERVLKHWEGLGYYSRARNLQKAARLVQEQFRGRIPDTREEILKLPGVGRYTAGALLSIAFNKDYPVLDGNVKRVVSRLFRLKENGGTSVSEKRLWDTAESMLPSGQAGDFNQAIMELGATVCLPKSPTCLLCPLSRNCEARRRGDPEAFPPAKPKPPSEKIEVSAAVILRNGKTYIQKRPQGTLMGGLWEFPGGKREKPESPEDCLQREIREELGLSIRIREKLMTLQHGYTRFRVTLHVYLCHLAPGKIKASSCEAWKWVHPRDLDAYAFPAANVKIVNYLKERAENGGGRSRRTPNSKIFGK